MSSSHCVCARTLLTTGGCSLKSYVMKVLVRLVQFDLLENTKAVIADTRGLLKDNRLSYFEEGGQRHDIHFGEDEVVLKRNGEFSSETVLKSTGRGESLIASPYGTMRLETRLIEKEKALDHWMVEYEIVGSGSPVSHIRLVWEITMQA